MTATAPERQPVEPRPEPWKSPSGEYAKLELSARADAPWTVAQLVGFRFAFSYFALYLFPFPLGNLPWVGRLVGWWFTLTTWMGEWTQVHIFGLPQPMPVIPTGSGDNVAAWANQLDWVLLALASTIVWSLLDRRRREYQWLNEWLRVYVRFGLASIMLGYGFAKIIPTQMPRPTLDRLVEPWGEFSPMGVLWTFMGYSSVYQVFTGLGEGLGSLFLVFRRTTTLGALLLCAVLSNVVLLNYTFDVPVKLYSSNLLAMAIFLAAPDAKRLINLLLLNRPVDPPAIKPLFTSRRLNVAGMVARTLLVGFIVYNLVSGGLRYWHESIGPDAPKLPVFGIWDVEQVTKNGAVQPLVISDSLLLKRVVFSQLNRGTLRFMADSVERYTVKADSAKRELVLTDRFNPKIVRTFGYERPDSGHLVLAGRINNDSLVVRMRRLDDKKFNLMSRSFHWVQELPYNR